MSIQEQIIDIIETILKHQGMAPVEVSLDAQLYDEGVGLDSMCVAELSATLEKRFGKDPYTQGVLPHTVADLVEYFS